MYNVLRIFSHFSFPSPPPPPLSPALSSYFSRKRQQRMYDFLHYNFAAQNCYTTGGRSGKQKRRVIFLHKKKSFLFFFSVCSSQGEKKNLSPSTNDEPAVEGKAFSFFLFSALDSFSSDDSSRVSRGKGGRRELCCCSTTSENSEKSERVFCESEREFSASLKIRI